MIAGDQMFFRDNAIVSRRFVQITTQIFAYKIPEPFSYITDQIGIYF